MIYAGGDIEIRNSSVRGTSCSVSGPSALKIANTKLNGPVQGTPKCAGVYDANYTFFPNTCP